MQEYQISDSIRCTQVAPDIWILAYNPHLKDTVEGIPIERTEMEASVWAKRNGEWKNTFLHEVAKQ